MFEDKSNIGDLKNSRNCKSCKNNDCAIRIGVNSGSLERDIRKFKEPCPEAMVESALRNIKL